MYLIDSNVLIQAKNGAYGMDIAPGFWDWMESAHASSQVFTVAAVVDELKDGGDDLATWVRGMPPTFGLPVTGATAPSLAATSQWVAGQPQFTPAARSEFLRVADYFLVAQGAELNFTVVTHERPDPAAKRRIKIPDACAGVGVSYMTPWQVLRAEGVKFIVA